MDALQSRRRAGQLLAQALDVQGAQGAVVLALAPGGVPIGLELARALGGPLDIAPVAAVASPECPDRTLAAVAPGPLEVRDPEAIRVLGLGEAKLGELVALARARLQEQLLRWRNAWALPWLAGRTAILAADRDRSGLLSAAGIRWLEAHQVGRIVVAVAASSAAARRRIRAHAVEWDALVTAEDPAAVFTAFADEPPPTDETIAAWLSSTRAESGPPVVLAW
jgi:putative phosphoribosyl transferase